MRSDGLVWAGAAAGAIAIGVLLGFGASGAAVAIIALGGLLLFAFVGGSIARPVDQAWLARWVALGFLAKLAGTGVRYYMVTELYGIGDSFHYYTVGTELAKQWRGGDIPSLTGAGSVGTQITEAVTGALFAVFTPDMLGGFLMFAIVAYSGQILLYTAFRRHAKPHHLKPYAFLIFVLPTYVFWPSSIGKDALVLFGLGASAYFVARTLEAFEFRWLFGLAGALLALGAIRVHIAGLIVGALIGATLLSRISSRRIPGTGLRRLLLLGAGLGAALVVIAVFPDVFGVDILDSQDRDAFSADIVRRTSEKGTVAAGRTASSLFDLPAALAHVLFRPWPWEATEIQHLLAAGETAMIAGLFAWKAPAILRNIRSWQSNPYVVFSTLYTLAFCFFFSAIRNLGIIARQRGQVLAFFLVLIITLGFETDAEDEPTAQPELVRSAS